MIRSLPLLAGLLLLAPTAHSEEGRTTALKEPPLHVDLRLTSNGLEPRIIRVAFERLVHLKVTRTTDVACTDRFELPEYDLRKPLPLNQTVEITFRANERGTFPFGCNGQNTLIVE